MAGFLSDLLAGVPVLSLPNDADDVALNTGPMLKGLRDALQRLNDELEFVQNLRVAREKIDDIEKKLKDSASFEEEVLKQQRKNNEGIIGHSLKLDEHEEKFKSVENKLDAATSSSRREGKGGPLAGHPKDLPRWTSSQTFSQWKFVFVTGLNGIVPGF